MPEIVRMPRNYMLFQTINLMKPDLTMRTGEWLLPSVQSHVCDESGAPWKPCRAHLALVRLHAVMYLHVHYVVGSLKKLLSTLLTLRHASSRVDALVYVQFALF